MSNFMDTKNLERLYNLIGKNINKKYGKDITKDNDSMELLKKTMIDINNKNPKNINDKNQDHIIKLSKLTLTEVLNIYKQKKNQVNIIDRNIQSLNIKNNNVINNRPQPSVGISNTINNFNELKQERNLDKASSSHSKIDFSDSTDINEIVNVNKTYEELMKDREIGFEELQNKIPENNNSSLNQQFTLLQDSTDNKSEIQEQFSKNNQNQNQSSNYEELIQKEYVIQKKEEDSEYTNLPDSNELLTSVNDYFPESKMNLQDVKKPDEYNYRTYNLIINSGDRKWYGEYSSDGNTEYPSSNLSRYDYNVTFAPESDNTFKIPVYENNEFKALDINKLDEKLRILKGDKELNTDGFTFRGKAFSTFDKTKPKGNIIDYEYGIAKGSTDTIHINKRFKNIVSIRLKRIILPLIDEYLFNAKDGQIYIGCKIEPYMLVGIDEFDSNIVSSTTYGQNIFCKVVYSTEYSFIETDLNYKDGEEITQSRGYIHLVNEDNDFKEFTPSPLSELNKLSLKLLRPDGKLYSNVNDNLQVTHFKQSSDKRYMTLTLNQKVHPHTFKQSDKIIIKNLIVNNGNSTLPASISKYLENGAYIFKRNPSISNEIYISYYVEGYEDIDTNPDDNINNYLYGGYEDLLEKSTGVANWTTGINIKGFLINMSHQHSYVLEVKTKEVAGQDVINSEII